MGVIVRQFTVTGLQAVEVVAQSILCGVGVAVLVTVGGDCEVLWSYALGRVLVSLLLGVLAGVRVVRPCSREFKHGTVVLHPFLTLVTLIWGAIYQQQKPCGAAPTALYHYHQGSFWFSVAEVIMYGLFALYVLYKRGKEGRYYWNDMWLVTYLRSDDEGYGMPTISTVTELRSDIAQLRSQLATLQVAHQQTVTLATANSNVVSAFTSALVAATIPTENSGLVRSSE